MLSTITVTTTTDELDAGAAVTVASLGSGGADNTISLREALVAATNTGGATEIDIPTGTYNLGSVGTTEIRVGKLAGTNITIKGLGTPANTIINQTISGNRIFNFDNNGTGNIAASIANVTIQGATNVNKLFGGGAIVAGSPGDSLTLTNDVFQNNSTSNVGVGISRNGGAISYSGGGNLTITDSTFSNNTAGGNATTGSAGGAIAYNNSTNAGLLSITNSTFTNNSATGPNSGTNATGGALFISGVGAFPITATTFTNNSATGTIGTGGAIAAGSGTITITKGRFFNDSAGSGSGIDNTGATITANDNWWGADGFPGSVGTDTIVTTAGSTAVTTRLALELSASPSSIATNSTSTLTAKIVSNSAPTVAVTGTALEGLNLTFAPGTLGSVSPSSVAISNGTASTTFSSGSSFGTTSPSVTLDNGTKTTSLTIIGPPTANNQSVNVAFNTAKAITLTGSDPNNPAQTLTYTVSANPAHGLLSGTAPNLTYTPDAGYHGADSFQFHVNNGFEQSNTATVSINVAAGVPTANPQLVNVAFNTATPITLTASDPDVPALSLTYTVSANPSHGILSGTAPNLTYTPAAGYHGADSFQFTASNGTNTSSPATVSITVATGTPTANNQSVNVAFNTAKAITLTASDPDVPALSLTYTVSVNPTHGILSGTAPNLTYTPNAGFHGSDSFQFTASNGTHTSNAATVTITVAAGTPTANNQSVNVPFNTATPITLTASDPDVPTLSLTYTVSANPSHGILSGTAPNLTYTPAAGYHGADSFQFTASNGTNTSAPATVSLTVATGTPTATGQSVNVNQNSSTPITLMATDPDVPPLSLTYTVSVNPTHGVLSGTAPNLTYTPNAGYSGPDSFQFTASNGTNTSNAATVTINVIPSSAVVSTISASWGTAGSAALQTAADGLRLLPVGRTMTIPWLNINKLSITLNNPAALTRADISVTGINVANYGPVTVSGGGTSYVITLAMPIAGADRVTLTIGNATIATFTRRLDVLPGDVNDDGKVDAVDVATVRNEIVGLAPPNVFADINGDGTVDINDYNAVRRRVGTHLP